MTRNVSVLVVEDDDQVRRVFDEFLRLQGFDVRSVSSGGEGISLLRENRFDVALTDLKLRDISGLEVIKEIRNLNADTVGIVITGHGTIDTAVQAMKTGAFDYVLKPVALNKLNAVMENALDHRKSTPKKSLSFYQARTRRRFERMVGGSEPMKALFKLIERIAPSDGTVLLVGESGTGKELVARSIHSSSNRNNGPFVPVNCGAIPEALLESEIFGHEKGSFTGAWRKQIGRFEKADEGTIFLDEVGDMSPILQKKILRVLQEREFERVGGMKTIRVDVRIIAATHRDLEDEIRKGNFREDLYYRLNVIPIAIPPLRERKSDIPRLVQHFLEQFHNGRLQKVKRISDHAMKILTGYSWPGNVRELENLIERLIVLGDKETICMRDLPEHIIAGSQIDATERPLSKMEAGLNDAVSQFEKELIMQALHKTDWVKNRAAKLLHLKRTTLLEKMKRNSIYGDVAQAI